MTTTTATQPKTVHIYKQLCRIADGKLSAFKNDLHEHDQKYIGELKPQEEAIWCLYSSGTRLNLIPDSYTLPSTKAGELLFDPNSRATTIMFNGFSWGLVVLTHTEKEYGCREIKPEYYRLTSTRKNYGTIEKITFDQAYKLADPTHKACEFWFRIGWQSYYYGGLYLGDILASLDNHSHLRLMKGVNREQWFKVAQKAYFWGRQYANEMSLQPSIESRMSSLKAWETYYKSPVFQTNLESSLETV